MSGWGKLESQIELEELFSKDRKKLTMLPYTFHRNGVSIQHAQLVKRIEKFLAETKPGALVSIPMDDALMFSSFVGKNINAQPKQSHKRFTIPLVTKWLGYANSTLAQHVAAKLDSTPIPF